MHQELLRPFACSYTPNVPELLHGLDCALALSTYQAGKLIFLSAADPENVIQLPRNFDKPMGIAYDPTGEKLALACKSEVHVFKNSRELAFHYPKSPNKYDSLFLPRVSYKTSYLDLHDLAFGHDAIYAVNTLFSCISVLSEDYNFVPYWKPDFITAIASEDRCHLNGMAMKDGKPKYVTCFNQGNTAQSWRSDITNTGVVLDVDTGETVATGLGMPHTPKLFQNDLYVLLSATGELVKIDTRSGHKESVIKLNSFVRGMDLCGEYLFIGLSKLRSNSKTFAHLTGNFSRNTAGVAIVHLPTGALAGEIQYHASVDEIYDVKVIHKTRRPNILNPENEDCNKAVSIPTSTFWASPEKT